MIKLPPRSSRKGAGNVVVFDSAPLVELYISGHFSTLAQQVYSQSTRIAVCRLVLPEAFAAINARARDRRITKRVAKAAQTQILRDWKGFIKLSPTVLVCSEAAKLTNQFPLKGTDAVHLAAFAYFLNFEPRAVFFTTDKQLYRAAQQIAPIVPVPGFYSTLHKKRAGGGANKREVAVKIAGRFCPRFRWPL